jgi:octaprenyl-diphosphate synthase
VILSFHSGSGPERAFWRRTLTEGEIRDGDLERAVGLIRKHQAVEATLERARYYGVIARDALDVFKDSWPKRALLEAVAFCVNRMH